MDEATMRIVVKADDIDGMTLRDYFAAKVIQGCFAADSESYAGFPSTEDVVAYAFKVADLMLAERERVK